MVINVMFMVINIELMYYIRHSYVCLTTGCHCCLRCNLKSFFMHSLSNNYYYKAFSYLRSECVFSIVVGCCQCPFPTALLVVGSVVLGVLGQCNQ